MSKVPSLPTGTLLVSSAHTICNNCGQHVLPSSATHNEVSGYGRRAPGCGIFFTHVTSVYAGDDPERWTRQLRPDLEYVSL